MIRLYIWILLFSPGFTAFAQQSWTIPIHVTFQGEALVLGKGYAITGIEDSVYVDKFQLYIGQGTVLQAGKIVGAAKSPYVLLTYPDSSGFSFELTEGVTPDRLSLGIGVDSATHAAGAMEGALDPMHGMYWTWQSGYINMKLEGHSAACPTRKGKFQFHLGGYQAPNNTFQQVSFPLRGQQPAFIEIPLDAFFQHISLTEKHSIMSPQAEAVHLSQVLADLIISHQP